MIKGVYHKDTVTNLICTSSMVMHKRETHVHLLLCITLSIADRPCLRAEPIRSLNSRANVIDDPDVN
jgi:hypothetical protein